MMQKMSRFLLKLLATFWIGAMLNLKSGGNYTRLVFKHTWHFIRCGFQDDRKFQEEIRPSQKGDNYSDITTFQVPKIVYFKVKETRT